MFCGWRLVKREFQCWISIPCSLWLGIPMTMWLPLVAAKRISCLSSPPKQTPPILPKNTISQEAVKIAPEPLSCSLMQANHRYFLCIKSSRNTFMFWSLKLTTSSGWRKISNSHENRSFSKNPPNWISEWCITTVENTFLFQILQITLLIADYMNMMGKTAPGTLSLTSTPVPTPKNHQRLACSRSSSRARVLTAPNTPKPEPRISSNDRKKRSHME